MTKNNTCINNGHWPIFGSESNEILDWTGKMM